MAIYKATGVPHSMSVYDNLGPFIFRVEPEQDSEHEALLRVWRSGDFTILSDLYEPPTREQFETLKAEGTLLFELVDIGSGETGEYAYLWYRKEDGKTDLGYCKATDGSISDADRHNMIWVEVEDWTPPTEERERLEKLSKQELVELLLIAQARG